MRRCAPPALAALVAAVLLTGCAPQAPALRPPRSATGAADVLARPVPDEPLPTEEPDPLDPPDPDEAAEERPDLRLDDGFEGMPLLFRIWTASPPRGSGPQIALRFMQALQRGDDYAADRELDQFDRFLFEERPVTVLHKAMDDVRRNAGLAAAGPCEHATPLSRESAVVLCGRVHVVVHVPVHGDDHGVKINKQHARKDVFRGPHTHAVTGMFRPEI